ncbi:hypothetical protein KC331_g2626, partial [Hortaea werneckii]
MSSRSTSPDPITLPSSPLAAHSVRASSAIPLAPRSPNKFSSPSKSFLLDAGGGGATGKAGVSPWRLRVTVEPEFMRDASLSPTKARRGGGAWKKQGSIDAQSMAVQQKVPLRDVEQEGGSPLKQPPRRRRRATPAKVRPEENVGEELEVRRPARKRKGTPIRRHGTREKVARQDEDTEEQEGEEHLFGTTTPPSADLPRSRQQRSQILQSHAVAAPDSHPSPQHLQVSSSSSRPTSRTSAKSKDKRRSSLQPYHFRHKDGTLRTARLSQAREELDTALQDALGYSDEIFSPSDDHQRHHYNHSEEGRRNDDNEDDDEAEPDDQQANENTVSINEDFTMVSVETLQSMKTGGGGTEGETSLVSHHRHSQGVHPGEKSGLSVSYLPSSPPKEDLPATTAGNGDADGDGGDREGQGTEMEGAVLVGEMDGYTSTVTRDQGREEGVEEVAEFEREEEGGGDEEAHEETGGYDVMSWKPTGPAKGVDSYNHSTHETEPKQKEGGMEYSLSEVESGEDDGDAHSAQHEEQDDEEEEDSQAQLGAQQSPPHNQTPPINNNNNNEALQADEDDDIWYEEASRSLEQDMQEEEEEEEEEEGGNKSFSKPSSSSRHRQPNPRSSQPPTDTNDPSKDTGPNNIQDLLATNQPNKPPRAKIPRTWRRSSGMDFVYSDSPARESDAGRRETESVGKRKHDGEEGERGQRKRKTSGKRGGGGADASAEGEATDRSSGVLTPPSSGGEDGGRGERDGEGGEGDSSLVSRDGEGVEDRTKGGKQESANVDDEEEEGDFTFPDAAATGIHFDDEGADGRTAEKKAFPGRRRGRPTAAPKQPIPSHSNNTTTIEETGLYWQDPNLLHPRHGPAQESSQDSSSLLPAAEKPARKFPGRRRPRPREGMMVKKAMDLSELLGMGGGKEEGSVDEGERGQGGEENVEESWESKASDQRQLLGEMSGRRRKVGGGSKFREVVSQAQESSEDHTPEGEEMDDDATDDRLAGEESTFRSYEEFLNRDSPTKVQVKFGDSLNSSLLAPKKEYSSLFAQGAAYEKAQPTSQPLPVVQSAGKRPPQSSVQAVRTQRDELAPSLTEPSPGILDRLTTNFWSALIRPTGPTEVLPEPSRHSSTSTKPNCQPKQDRPPPFQPTSSYPTTLRTRLRSRYGVLSASHPWTLAHMRTLHRMLNSATSGKSDSVIPTPHSTIHNQTSHSFSTTSTSSSSASTSTVSLSSYLSSLISSVQTSYSGNHQFVFTETHAQVVEAFMAILVPDPIISAIEKGEIDGLGDSTARKLRG